MGSKERAGRRQQDLTVETEWGKYTINASFPNAAPTSSRDYLQISSISFHKIERLIKFCDCLNEIIQILKG